MRRSGRDEVVLRIVLLLCGAMACTGCVTVYGKRAYREQVFRLVEEKTARPISGAKVFIFATQGPQILPSMQVFRPHPGFGETDRDGYARMLVPEGPKIEPMAAVIRGTDFICQISDGEENWSRRKDGVIVLEEKRVSARPLRAGDVRAMRKFEREARRHAASQGSGANR